MDLMGDKCVIRRKGSAWYKLQKYPLNVEVYLKDTHVNAHSHIYSPDISNYIIHIYSGITQCRGQKYWLPDCPGQLNI